MSRLFMKFNMSCNSDDWYAQQMHQSLRGFVAERVNRKESVLEALNAGLEEALDLFIQIEKPDPYPTFNFSNRNSGAKSAPLGQTTV